MKIIHTAVLNKVVSIIFMNFLPFALLYFKNNVGVHQIAKYYIAQVISFSLPFISIPILISIFLEMKRGYGIKIDKNGMSFGLFSLEMNIPWDGIISMRIKKMPIYRNVKVEYYIFVINNKLVKYNRKANVFDQMFNAIIPFRKEILQISVKQLRIKKKSLLMN